MTMAKSISLRSPQTFVQSLQEAGLGEQSQAIHYLDIALTASGLEEETAVLFDGYAQSLRLGARENFLALIAGWLEDPQNKNKANTALTYLRTHFGGISLFASPQAVSHAVEQAIHRRRNSPAQAEMFAGGIGDGNTMHRQKNRPQVLATADVGALWRAEERSVPQTEILDRVERLVRETPGAVVVLDLDDCLLATRAREVRILREYGVLHDIEPLKNIQLDQITSWNLRDVLVDSLGLEAEWVDAHLGEIRAFWNARFFSNEYAAQDMALPGAPEYFQLLHRLGAHIVYISGRSEEEMGEGTREALRRNGFPLDQERVTLILKNASNRAIWSAGMTEDERIDAQRQADAKFKREAIERARSLGTVVASFDNEPTNINQYHQEFHAGGVGVAVRVETSQARNLPLKDGVVSIQGFLR